MSLKLIFTVIFENIQSRRQAVKVEKIWINGSSTTKSALILRLEFRIDSLPA